MTELLAMFAGGLLGSAHCVGMCGGFAAIVGANRRRAPQAVARQLVYCTGRVFTYAFLGAMGGYAGLRLSQWSEVLPGVQRAFSLGAGALMVLLGLTTLGLWRFRWRWLTSIGGAVVPVFRHFLDGQDRGGVFLAGVANGFLPCGLVYAFLALAVASGSPPRGLLMMLFFGLGTIPGMTIIGCGSTLLSHGARLHVYRLAACFVIVAGAMSIWRAWPSSHVDACCAGHAPGVAASATTAVVTRAAEP
jgi:hypothetical protein